MAEARLEKVFRIFDSLVLLKLRELAVFRS
jgi:hypothetical protein